MNKLSRLTEIASAHRGTLGLLVGMNIGSFLTYRAARAGFEWQQFLQDEGVLDIIAEAQEK